MAATQSEHEMTVNVTTVPRENKAPRYLYPFRPLAPAATTYRGYPVEGKTAFKSGRWKIQIVSPACRSPPEPLPQFPQQEVLKKTPEGQYVGAGRMDLSPEAVANNSGEAYLESGDETPTSEFFYTAGYEQNSAVKLKKEVGGSIYRSFVTGQPVPVRVVKENEED